MPPLCELGSLLEPNVRIYCFKFLKLARPTIIADPLILRTNFCLLFSKIPLGPLGSKGLTLVLVLVQKVFHPVVQCCCWLVCCGEERRGTQTEAAGCRPVQARSPPLHSLATIAHWLGQYNIIHTVVFKHYMGFSIFRYSDILFSVFERWGNESSITTPHSALLGEYWDAGAMWYYNCVTSPH